MRTLFIGNSHTYFNDMPKLFRDICAENGIDMQVTMLTKGGMGLDYHADNEQTRFNILFGNYDYIILQHVAHPMGEFSVMEKATDQIMEWIRQTNAKACLFMTWTKDGDESGQPEMSACYRQLADKYGCLLAPVGEKWWEHIHQFPEIDLFYKDRRHASADGSCLIAKTIFETLDLLSRKE
ncbi:MAG: hypothetical protein J6N53_00530 [Lachnospiraceae bacterium]|nr:hypothetical protein [Lachnospiraceae bacterium]